MIPNDPSITKARSYPRSDVLGSFRPLGTIGSNLPWASNSTKASEAE